MSGENAGLITPTALLSLSQMGGPSAAARTEQPAGKGAFRLARKPTGELVLQEAVYWHQGSNGGIDWRDVPTVDIPADPVADKGLTDEDIVRVWQSMPGGPDGWLINFGFIQFARAVLEAAEDKRNGVQP